MSVGTSIGESVGYLDVIRGNARFRYLWLGQIVSLLGDWFNLIASAALIDQLTESGLAIGSLFVVRMLAPFVIAPIAGVVADRYNRKHVLIVTDVVRAVVVLGFLLVRTSSQVWLLYVLTAVQLAVSGFFFPTRNAILPDIVEDRELGAANAISSATWSVMLAVGAALGGLVSGAWGTQAAFLIDAVTFVVSALFIARIAYRFVPGISGQDKTIEAALQQYLDGLRYLRRHVDVLVISLHKGTNGLLIASSMQVIQVVIAGEIFVLGEGGSISLGLMYGIAGVGTGLGPIAARFFTGDRDRSLRRAITIGYCISIAGLATISTLDSFGIVLFGVLMRGIGGGIVWVFSTQLLLQLVPNSVRGRVFATEYAAFTLMSAIGAAAAGAGLDAGLGISTLVAWMAGLTILPVILWGLWQLVTPGKASAPEDAFVAK